MFNKMLICICAVVTLVGSFAAGAAAQTPAPPSSRIVHSVVHAVDGYAAIMAAQPPLAVVTGMADAHRVNKISGSPDNILWGDSCNEVSFSTFIKRLFGGCSKA